MCVIILLVFDYSNTILLLITTSVFSYTHTHTHKSCDQVFRSPATESAEKLQTIVGGHFSERAEITYAVRDSMFHDDIPEVICQVFDAVWREMKLRKAPRIDGIPNFALKVAIESNGEVFWKVLEGYGRDRDWF